MTLKPLIDKFGRTITSVRISVTDRCNLRCQYCMPADGLDWLDKTKIMSFEEILFLTRLLVKRGIRKVRLTGGEPTVRKDIAKLCQMLTNELPDIELSMTTNGILLPGLANDLHQSGVKRLNISLDTLNKKTFNDITRRDDYQNVIKGIQAAISAGFEGIKVNAVSIGGLNSDWDSLKSFIDLSEQYNIEIRFIEYMPFTGMNWSKNGFVKSQDLRDIIAEHERLTLLPLKNSAKTSRTYELRGGTAKIGFISSVSESFCHSCDRIRITSEGILRPCLHANREYPLLHLIRSNQSEENIVKVINDGLSQKWKEHPDFLALNYLPPIDDREMIRLGG